VIIVGGGWSGASALEWFVSRGVNKVRLLEARDYLGGRSRTVNDVFVPGLSTELGSAWVYEATEIQDIIDDFGINFGEIDYNNDWSYLGLYAGDGEFNTDDDEGVAWEDDNDSALSLQEKRLLLKSEWEDWFVPFVEQEQRELRNRGEDASFASVMERYFDRWEIPEGNRYRQFLVAMVHSQLEIEYAGGVPELSTQTIGSSLNECIFCGSNHYMSVEGGGFDKLIAGLLNGVDISKHVQFQQTVTQVDYQDDLVRVTTTNGSDEQQIHTSRFVLVTVPLGVLKANTINFVPKLPFSKRSAISYMGFGTLNKCILFWDTPQSSWWPPEEQQVLTLIANDDDERWTTFFNDRALGNGGHYILTAWIGGEKAILEEDKSDDDILETVLQNVRSMFGFSVPSPSSYIITRWGKDPYARGAYSFIPVGTRSISGVRRDLARPVAEKVWFSGEATDDFYGTAVGAHRSGQRAAREILERL